VFFNGDITKFAGVLDETITRTYVVKIRLTARYASVLTFNDERRDSSCIAVKPPAFRDI
jgi:hypothetical protein